PAWFVRDSNWSPDFAVSTKQVLQFIEEEVGLAGDQAQLEWKEYNAVLGVTTGLLEEVMGLVGDITIGDETFTQSNITDSLEYAVELGFAEDGLPREQRKEIIGEIVDEIVVRLPRLSISEWNQLLLVMENNLQERNLMIYSSDKDIQALLDRQEWTGRVNQKTEGDYLMIVDANLGALKSDPAVHRAMTYTLETENNGDVIATATMNYDHQKNFDWKTTRYRTYTRFYVPLGSEFISSTGSLSNDKLKNPGLNADQIDISEELGKTVFGMFTSVEPLTQRDLIVRYRLPELIAKQIRQGNYELLIQKQLGAASHRLTLDLDFDKKLKDAEPAEDSLEWGDSRYRLNTILDQDRGIEVRL
ncbi:MAG: hypothetical protein O2877_01395, partial [bacterium]|nr:hypothetical protein [bacterium]